VITPSIPSATFAAASRPSFSPSSSTSPPAVTSRIRRTVAEKDWCSIPDPWVAVATAPAMPCVSMSPWFPSARPASQSGEPNAPTGVPGSAVTRPVPRSMSVTPFIRFIRTSVPPVRQIGLKEWPVPTQRTC